MGGHIFVSYASADRAYVRRLAAHLKDAGIEAWHDHETSAMARWEQVLKQMVDACAAVVVVMTPESAGSHWVGVEVEYALRLRKPVLPLLLRGGELFESREIFFSLSTIEYEDVSGGRMPTESLPKLARLVAEHGAETPEPPLPARRSGWTRRRVLTAAGSGLAVAAAGGGISWLLRPDSGPVPHASPSESPSRTPGGVSTGASATPTTSSMGASSSLPGGTGGSGLSPAATPTGSEGLMTGHTSTIWAVSWSPDSALVATASADRTARIWNGVTGAHIRTLTGHGNWVNAVAWSPDGSRIATGSSDFSARIWSAASGALIHELTGISGTVRGVAWSPDGARVATNGEGDAGAVWDAATGDKIIPFPARTGGVAWSPDGTRIVAGESIYDAATAEEQYVLTGHTSAVYGVGWSPDGGLIATSSWDHTVRIWDAQTGAHLRTLTGHPDAVRDVSWAPDSARVVSAGEDGTARIWRVVDGAQLDTYPAPWAVYAVAWSPDGSRIVVVPSDSTALIWSQ